MFGYIVAAVTAGAFAIISAIELSKATGDKVQEGDTVFIRGEKIRLVDTNDIAGLATLKTFLSGVVATAVRVTNVHIQKGSTGPIFTGTVIGFPDLVTFDKQDVTAIDRNGRRIV